MGKSLLISANAAYVFNNIGKVTFNDPSLIYNGLTITAQEDLTLRFSNDLEYRNNVSILWKPLKANTPLSIENGETVTLKGKLIPTTNGIGTFTVSGNFTASGNILSLINDGTMQNYSFKNLFRNCTTLTDVSNITLPDYVTQNCYEGMFYGCTSIEESPTLSVQTLQNNCYTDMFYGCSSLREITCKNISDISQYVNLNWVYGVASAGVFEIDSEGNWNDTNKASHIPENWEITTGVLTNKYLTFRILTPGTILWENTTSDTTSKTISYSKDDGETWTDITSSLEGAEITVVAGDKVLFKGNNTAYGYFANNTDKSSKFGGTAKFNVEGNIMSLISGDDFAESTSFNNNAQVFRNLFQGTNVVSAKKLVLPVLTLTLSCYQSLFSDTQYLDEVPELPATTLAESCYKAMFKNAVSITKTPNLYSTSLAKNCYFQMFYGCTSLTTVTELPLATMKEGCYQSMLQGCTSLTSISTFTISSSAVRCCRAMFLGCTSLTNISCSLTATSLSTECYYEMFNGCISLTTTPALPATTLGAACYYDMFKGCTSITSAPVLSATTASSECYRSMFEGCTSLVTPPALPATTLGTNCYRSMFYGCTSLTTAPALPAMTLADSCYYNMFYNCTSLATAPTLPATSLANSCYANMFYGCTSLTTAPVLPATTLANSCYSYMFGKCSSLTTAPDLLATTVYNQCYVGMFRYCSYLTYVKCMYNEVDNGATDWIGYMLSDVAATGTLVKDINIDWSGVVPSGWTIVDEGVLKPTISFDGQEITLDCQTSGATIYYQLNNTGNYIAYTGVISISSDTAVRTYAELNDVTSPKVYSYCVYAPTSLLDPTIEFNYGTTITLSCLTLNSTIYYRLNNTGSFIQYTEPIIINATTTIEAYSELDGTTSNTVSETFTFIDYSQQYFTIESLEDNNTINIIKTNKPSNINLSYSTDDGTTWTDLTISDTTNFATINTGDKIIFKGNNLRLGTAWDTYYRFNGSKTFNAYGNIMSLLNGDNFVNTTELNSSTNNHFVGLFYGTTTLIDANKLYLSASTLYYNSYNGMFRGCTNLKSAPQIQATTCAENECCSSMFEGCINLEVAPELNFTTLAQNCCKRMFCMSRNSNITTPKMTKSPILRCATTASGCYEEMFRGNGNLIEVTCLKTDNTDACKNWLANTSSTGTFKKASGKSWSTGTSGIPSGWTVEDYTE